MLLQCTSGGDAAAKVLIDLGVEFVFTLTGGHLNHMHMTLEKSSVQLISVRNEQAATFMADAYARMSGKPGIAMLTAGPGFTNCISPLQQAATNCTPLLVIAGASGTDYRDKLDLQDAAQFSIASPICKASFVCLDPSRVAEYVEMAYRATYTGRPGPVFLELPCNIAAAPVPGGSCVYHKTEVASKPVDRAGVRKAMELLSQAKKPIVIVGSGGGYSKAQEPLLAFVEKANIPVFTCNMGRGLVSDLHPLSFGLAAPNRPVVAEKAYRETDLAIVLGHRISLNDFFGGAYNQKASIIQVDICGEEIGRNRAIELPIVSDVSAFLQEACEVLDGGVSTQLAGRFDAWIAELVAEKKNCYEKHLPNITSSDLPMHPQRLVHEINQYMDREDDVVVGDGGDTLTWLQMGRTVRSPYRIMDHGLFWCIGGGMADVVAARLVYPKSRVMLVTGDGSIGFNFMEVTTALARNMAFVIVIANDQAWGMIRQSQKLRFGKTIDTVAKLTDVPYEKMVEAAGGKGFRVERPEDIKPALDAAFASNTVACVNIQISDQFVSPGSLALGQLGAYKITE